MLTYGQTQPGKMGMAIGDPMSKEQSRWGLMPLALRRMFELIALKKLEYTISISCVEVFNEKSEPSCCSVLP